MPLLNDVEEIIKALCKKYSNDNTFTSCITAYTVVLSHIPHEEVILYIYIYITPNGN